jgi:hypothetical protein
VVPNRYTVRFAAVSVLIAALTAAGGVASGSTGSPTRSCGTLAVGIGWHVAATRNTTCGSARQLLTTYLRRGGNRRATLAVEGYICARHDLPDAEHIRCSKSGHMVTARSFGY